MAIPDITKVHGIVSESSKHLQQPHRSHRRSSMSSCDEEQLSDHVFLSSSSYELCLEELEDEIQSYTILQKSPENDKTKASVLHRSTTSHGRISLSFDLVKTPKDSSIQFVSQGIPQLEGRCLDLQKMEADLLMHLQPALARRSCIPSVDERDDLPSRSLNWRGDDSLLVGPNSTPLPTIAEESRGWKRAMQAIF